ncbi:hypothetical protein ACS0TY_021184 [Phlomoides rotata]
MLNGVSTVRSKKVKDELVFYGNDIELVSQSLWLLTQEPATTSAATYLDIMHPIRLDKSAFEYDDEEDIPLKLQIMVHY